MNSTSVVFQDTDKSLADTLNGIAANLPAEKVTLRELLGSVGEQSLLFFCIIMTTPFLTPIPLPGISTVFGFLIMLLSFGIIFNRVPWLPGFLMKREFESKGVANLLTRAANLCTKLERFIFPRLQFLTHQATTNRLNGIMLLIGGFLLILPLPVIPLSNTLPGWAVLCLCVGMIQRDGLFVLLGYLLNIITIIYFGALVVAALLAGQGLSTVIGSGFIWLLLR
jgi:hypothetical protein